MSKYVLRRGKKKQPLVGIGTENRNGINIVHYIDVIFEPGKVVETDLDFDHWVEVRILDRVPYVDIDEGVIAKVGDVDIYDGDGDTDEDRSGDGEPNSDGDGDGEPNGDGDEDGDTDNVEFVGDGSDKIDMSGDYEEMEDGSFSCLHCEKILKREKAMLKHIEKMHK